uniref:mRNA cap guanine-N(7) methyltransferase n=1 Tax=Hirondellea gigas TaxID=1518452 RepID=A0A2P2I394_9CRUS
MSLETTDACSNLMSRECNPSSVSNIEVINTRSDTETTVEHHGHNDSENSSSDNSGSKRPLEQDDAVQQKDVTKAIKVDTSLGNVVAGHYNNLEEQGLAVRNQSRILHMRNFNNWIKSFLINKHMQEVRESVPADQRIVAIDLGCGKGGDLLKWTKANIRHLVCVDIAETSVNQAKERFEYTKKKRNGAPTFSAEFIVADCTKVRFQSLLRDPCMKVHIVSCQFAFHYCFESLRQAETMIKNATSSLSSGGYFILTIPDANFIMKQLSRGGGSSFGNEVFRIEFPEDRGANPPLFGDRYQFYLEGVVNCPEFLVHQPTLKSLCKKYGLTCVYQKRFSEVYKEAMQEPQSRGLLHKMTALELYPSADGSQSSNNPREYESAKDHLDDNKQSSVLTLSASEWDAINVYTAFAFKKC